MSTVVVVGLQWGDEGKGKITDFLASQADLVARYQGGNNAGHTVVVGDEEFKLHLVPSGILYPGTQCVLGNGVVINPGVLLKELAGLKDRGIDISGLKISDRAHVIMPYHPALDQLDEASRTKGKIGTTGRGIGPAYVDKYARYDAIRMVDLLDEAEFTERLTDVLEVKNKTLDRLFGHPGFETKAILDEYLGYAEALRPMVTDTSVLINQMIRKNRKVLFEGAQGTLLDIDHGTFPFVSSSSPSSGGVCAGTGVGPTRIGKVVGVVKAYSTRVGEGPFPTELPEDLVSLLRDGRGREYGVTTGRPRRCGWFDGVIAEYSVRINGVNALVVMKLDVLDQLETIKICTGYRYRNSVIKEFPASLKVLAECTPVYQELPGWLCDTTQAKELNDLPPKARDYLSHISDLAQAPIAMVSVGWRRDETIMIEPVW
ncbi:adenylosuccinate synthetase [Hydrogenispora ethanolica]|jgi:adenylosuccinate synthase|uniref:Adenylosuccinate synthetase n=1 Tax=Hydrogenispora ethanolica TaxID=1082276 RepID=A0A4V2QFK6_HYDET|nr:adenylosuccinate synthase [Hydrogenispora ethanolica]TCL72337.1 adenylosuccinate synthetase [Hydrogenispora ethanolica]